MTGNTHGDRRRDRKYKKWTREDLRHLRALVRMRCTPKQIAAFLRRTESAVRLKAWKMGLKFRHPLPRDGRRKPPKDTR